jgi:hypothetical protein
MPATRLIVFEALAVNVGGFGFMLGSLANLIALRLSGDRRAWLAFHGYAIPFLIPSEYEWRHRPDSSRGVSYELEIDGLGHGDTYVRHFDRGCRRPAEHEGSRQGLDFAGSDGPQKFRRLD